MSVYPLKSILMSEPWQKSKETTRMPAPLQQIGCSQAQKPSLANLSTQHISWLWMELTRIYGTLFVTKYGSKDNGTWFEALNDLTPKALESGMARLRNLSGEGKFIEYPPNCLQFKALCLAFYDDLNLPKPSLAYREIKNSTYKTSVSWSHPLTEFIANKLPDDFFKMEQEGVAYAVFKNIYEQACRLVQQGHEIPKTKAPHRVRPTQTPEVARAYLNQIKHHIGVSRNEKLDGRVTDHAATLRQQAFTGV